MTPLFLALAVAAAGPDRDARSAWALGYVSVVERACPGWRWVSARELARRGMIGRPTVTDWGVEGPLADRYWQGVERATSDGRRPGRCHPARWPASVRQVLQRGNESPRR